MTPWRTHGSGPFRDPGHAADSRRYAPALRPLRQVARVIRFRKPASQLLVKRLQEVCAAEGLTADLRSLTTLVDLTGGDVRSCLNTLQVSAVDSFAISEKSVSCGSARRHQADRMRKYKSLM